MSTGQHTLAGCTALALSLAAIIQGHHTLAAALAFLASAHFVVIYRTRD